MKINVCLLQPPGYIHSLALLEAAEYIVEKCKTLNFNPCLKKNRLISEGLNIVFGAHINPAANLAFPQNTVIFNTEQLTANQNSWVNDEYLKLLSKFCIWDYSQTNLDCISHSNKFLVNFYHVEGLKRVELSNAPQFDLLFYGSMNERRKQIIQKLTSKNIKVQTIFGLYGPERDTFFKNTKAILNLHYYDSQIFQQIRAFYPLSNGIPIISENFPVSSAPLLYTESILTPGSHDFVDFVVHLFQNPNHFQEISQKSLCVFQESKNNIEFDAILEKTLALIDNSSTQNQKKTAEKLNLGSGKDYRFDHLNVDLRPEVFPDLIFDLSKKINFPVDCLGENGQPIQISEGQFDEIIANDVLEHVPDLERLMTNCLKILKEGGEFKINVPYDLSLGAWQDPTHIRGFNQNSWLYYTDWFWYLAWFEWRFDLKQLEFILSPLGAELQKQNIDQNILLRTPRAVESMKLNLVKRKTTLEEKNIARSYSNVFYPLNKDSL